MDKYMLIRELGLQVFTKPLSSDTMLVSADDLAEALDKGTLTVKTDRTLLTLSIPHNPKTLEEKIVLIIKDERYSSFERVELIRKLVKE